MSEGKINKSGLSLDMDSKNFSPQCIRFGLVLFRFALELYDLGLEYILLLSSLKEWISV